MSLSAALAAALAFAAAAAGAAADTSAGVPDGYVRVPGGRAVHGDCVRRVPAGSHIRHDGDDLLVSSGEGGAVFMRVPPCPHAVMLPLHGPAWKAWTQAETPRPLTGLNATWKVPGQVTDPGEGDEILYFWIGIEPDDNSAVLQPVLAWGSNPSAPSGAYWSYASWYVSGSHGTIVTPAVATQPGSTIVGSLSFLNNGSWTTSAHDQTAQSNATFTYTPASADYTWAYPCVLEAYNTPCTGYAPASSVTFTNIVTEMGGQPVSPDWTPMTKDNTCGEHATVDSPTQVTIDTSSGSRL